MPRRGGDPIRPAASGTTREKSWEHQTIGWLGADAVPHVMRNAATAMSERAADCPGGAGVGASRRWHRGCSDAGEFGRARMRDRRRTPRYILGTPLSGDALPMEDVTVERYSKRRIVVFSQTAHDQDEQLMIHVSTTGGVQ